MLKIEGEIVDALKQKNFYAPPPPERNPVTQVNAIVGDEALINGEWHKAGDSIGEAKLLEVWPTYVVVQWRDEENQLGPNGAPDSPDAGGSQPPSRSPRDEGERVMMANREMLDGLPPGMEMPSPEEIERLKNMSREEQEAFMRARLSR